MTLGINACINVMSDFDKMLVLVILMREDAKIEIKKCTVLNRFSRVANEMEHV